MVAENYKFLLAKFLRIRDNVDDRGSLFTFLDDKNTWFFGEKRISTFNTLFDGKIWAIHC